MTAATRGLGKGLDALLKGYGPTQGQQPEIQHLPLDVITPNSEQPRQEFNSASLQELAQSIKSQGVLQPILVRKSKIQPGTFEIVAGERRWRASRIAGLAAIPALIREISDHDALVVALVENLQREDLNPIEEAEALSRLKSQLDVQQDELARRVGKSRPAVANTLRLLQLEEDIREQIRSGALSAAHGRTLLGVGDPAVRHQVFSHVMKKGLSVRELESIVSTWKGSGRLPRAMGQRPERTKNDFAASLQRSLSSSLGSRIKVSGTEAKGRITLSYASQQELQKILKLLDAPKSHVSHETYHGQ